MKKNILISFGGILLSMCAFATPTLASKPSIDNASAYLNTAAGKAGVPQTTVTTYTGQIIKAGLTIVGLLFFILMIYAGFRWMTARGDEEKVKKAQRTVTAAIIGLAVIIASYAITSFVTSRIVEGNPNEGGTTDFSNLNYTTNGCCFDQVRAPGAWGELRATNWSWRITTQANCEQEGNNANSTIDELYGPGTWYFAPVDSANQCKVKYDLFCQSHECYDLGF